MKIIVRTPEQLETDRAADDRRAEKFKLSTGNVIRWLRSPAYERNCRAETDRAIAWYNLFVKGRVTREELEG